MTKADVIEATKPPGLPPELVLHTSVVRWQGGHAGHSWGEQFKEAVIHLPAEVTDARYMLDHPAMWRKIQIDPNKALSRWDRVTCIAHDETWAVIGIVTEADRERVTIHPLHSLTKLPGQKEQWSDEEHFVKWHDGAFAVFRKLDNLKLSGGYQTVGAAVHFVNTSYPRQVSA